MESKAKLPDELRAKLRKPFPPEALTTLPGASKLTAIKSMYVIERLNDVFGLAGWIVEHEIVVQDQKEIVVRGKICLREYNLCTSEQYGGKKKFGPMSWEDVYKSAVTSLISKCASYLEIGVDVFKGNVDPYHQEQVAPEPQRRVANIIPEDKFSFDLLEKGKWDQSFLDDGTFIELVGKSGKRGLYKLNEFQIQACESFIATKAQQPVHA